MISKKYFFKTNKAGFVPGAVLPASPSVNMDWHDSPERHREDGLEISKTLEVFR